MAIRFTDVSASRAQLAASLDSVGAALAGTHAAPPGRTGVVGSQLAGASSALTGLFSPTAARTGLIASALDSVSSLISGTNSAGASQSGQLQTGFYISAKMPLTAVRIIHPRPDTETQSTAYHRNAHPNVQYVCPIFIQGGAYPFWFKLVSGPTGATIGGLQGGADYGVVRWTPTSGTQTFVVRVFDQDGATVDITWTVTVGTAWVSFVDAVNGNDAGTGLFATPWKTYAKAVSSVTGGKAVCLMAGTYNAPASSVAFTNSTHSTLFGFPGASVTMNCGTSTANTGCWNESGSDLFVGNVFFSGGPTGQLNPRCFTNQSGGNRLYKWACSFDNPPPGTAGSGVWDNQASWFLGDPGSQRSYVALVGCAFSRLPPSGNGYMVIDTYNTKYLLIDGNTFGAPNASIGEQYAIFVKGGGNQEVTTRGNIWNQGWQTTLICFYLGSDGSGTGSTNQEMCYNRLVQTSLTGWASICARVNNGQNNSVAAKAWSYRNTFYGTPALAYHNVNLLTFTSDSDVIVTNAAVAGTVGSWLAINPGDAQDHFRDPATIPGITLSITGTECQGNSAAGILDSNFLLTGSFRATYYGKRGAEITPPGAIPATPVFNYTTFTGATPVSSINNSGSGISGGVAHLTSGAGAHQGGVLWNLAQVDIRSFTTNFTFTLPTFNCVLTAGSANITLPSSNGLGVNSGVRFGGNLASVTGLSPLAQYSVTSLSTVGGTTTLQVSSTSGGAAITMGGTGTANATIVAISGMTFSVQASNTTTNLAGFHGTGFVGDANLSGIGGFYGTGPGGTAQFPLGNSINIKLDTGTDSQAVTSYGPGQAANAAGLYINGGPFNALTPIFDLNPYGLDLNTGDLMSANIVYDGSNLVAVFANTVTGAQARLIWPLPNLTSIVGGTTAWVGMTAGMIPAAQAIVNTWSYSTGFNPRLAAPSFSPTPAAFSSSQTVTLSASGGAAIYYSTNGLPPTTSSTLYTGPITVSATQNLQAIAVQSGHTDSFPAGGVFQIATGAPKINFPSGFASAVSSGQIVLNGYPFLNGPNIQLLQDTIGWFEMGSAWYAVPQSISTFSTSFTFAVASFGNTGNGNAGFTFCLQNYNQSPTTFNTAQDGGWVSGGPSSMLCASVPCLGYAGATDNGGQTPGFGSSICIAFDLAVGSFGGVGLYSGGAAPTGSTVAMASTMNLHNGHPYTAALTYDGTTLSLLLTDTVTSNTYSHSWTVNIPALVGASTAYAGFTAADGFSWANIQLSNWTM